MPVEDILEHTATPVRNVEAEDEDEWAQGEPDEDRAELDPFDCALFLPQGTEEHQAPRGRTVRRPTLLYLPEREDGTVVGLKPTDELLIVAPELNLAEGLAASAEVRYQVEGSAQPNGRPGEDVVVMQVTLTRVREQEGE